MPKLLSDEEMWDISSAILKKLSDQMDDLNELPKERKLEQTVQRQLAMLRNMAKQVGAIRWDLCKTISRRRNFQCHI